MSEKHVYELKRARKLIESGEHTFICNALMNPIRTNREIKAICKQIRIDLEKAFTLNMWLFNRNIISFDEVLCPEANKNRATRLAWIDALIEYWKDKP